MARKPELKRIRVFGGKRYEVVASYWKKQSADNAAGGLKRQGRRARVVKISTGAKDVGTKATRYYYSVYVGLR